jgi:hypothetical protein
MITASSSRVLRVLPGLGRWDGPNTQKINTVLKKSWAHIFREQVLPLIPSYEIGEMIFCSNNGRPSNDVSTYIGLMILQEYHNLTDEETVLSLISDTFVQYALQIDNPTDDNVYMTRKSFWDFKEKVRAKKLHDLIFNKVTMGLANLHDVDTRYVRLDSVHIRTNMKNLTRGGLFHKTIDNFLGNLKKRNNIAFDTIDASITSKYLKDKTGYDYFGQVKPTERVNLLKSMAKDVLTLVRMFENDDRVSSMQSFYSLKRLLKEQCSITPSSEDSPEEKLELLEPKQVSGDSLQNPSDPDAGYDGHKGKGHQVQIVETFQPEKSNDGAVDSEEKSGKNTENSLSLIIHVRDESAAKHDSEAVIPAAAMKMFKRLKTLE